MVIQDRCILYLIQNFSKSLIQEYFQSQLGNTSLMFNAAQINETGVITIKVQAPQDMGDCSLMEV